MPAGIEAAAETAPAAAAVFRKSPPESRLLSLGMRTAGRIGAGLNGLLGSRAHGRVGILGYHRIAASVPGLPPPTQNVTPPRFREHLTGLLRRGFQIWPLRRLLECRAAGEQPPPRTLAVTFDDGFATTFTQAWPVLRELGIPATVFLATAYLDCREPFPFDAWGTAVEDRAPAETYRPLTTQECRQMTETGLVELGAHTHRHEDFRGRPAEFRRDLKQCLEALGSRFGLGGLTFAYPYGSPRLGFAGDELAAVVRESGLICGLTTRAALVELKSDPFRWGRFNVFPWDTSATLAAKLAGWYSWAVRLRGALTSPLGSHGGGKGSL